MNLAAIEFVSFAGVKTENHRYETGDGSVINLACLGSAQAKFFSQRV
jgi:hypothetical protein